MGYERLARPILKIAANPQANEKRGSDVVRWLTYRGVQNCRRNIIICRRRAAFLSRWQSALNSNVSHEVWCLLLLLEQNSVRVFFIDFVEHG
ncbi:hypothetical protein MHYP_G00339970 [Metynnis hypsauchen]